MVKINQLWRKTQQVAGNMILQPMIKKNMPDINAAIGLAQIKKYKHFCLKERKYF